MDFSELFTSVGLAERVDIVSISVIVEDLLGVGNFFNEEKSHDIALFGVGFVASPGAGGRSFWTLEVLSTLALSLSFSLSSRLPMIHHTPEGLLCTLISSVFEESISPAQVV